MNAFNAFIRDHHQHHVVHRQFTENNTAFILCHLCHLFGQFSVPFARIFSNVLNAPIVFEMTYFGIFILEIFVILLIVLFCHINKRIITTKKYIILNSLKSSEKVTNIINITNTRNSYINRNLATLPFLYQCFLAPSRENRSKFLIFYCILFMIIIFLFIFFITIIIKEKKGGFLVGGIKISWGFIEKFINLDSVR